MLEGNAVNDLDNVISTKCNFSLFFFTGFLHIVNDKKNENQSSSCLQDMKVFYDFHRGA